LAPLCIGIEVGFVGICSAKSFWANMPSDAEVTKLPARSLISFGLHKAVFLSQFPKMSPCPPHGDKLRFETEISSHVVHSLFCRLIVW